MGHECMSHYFLFSVNWIMEKFMNKFMQKIENYNLGGYISKKVYNITWQWFTWGDGYGILQRKELYF